MRKRAKIEQKKLISVIGGGSKCAPKEIKLAEAVGKELAKNGAILICGGLGGVMEAACKGAISAGGTTIGILPGEIRQQANPHVTIPIVTTLGFARNIIVAKSAQAVIAIGGSYGTLCEISYALQGGIPVIGLNTWSISRKGEPDNSIITAKNPTDAVRKALKLAVK